MDIMYMATLVRLFRRTVVILVIMDIMYMFTYNVISSVTVVILFIMDIMYMGDEVRK